MSSHHHDADERDAALGDASPRAGATTHPRFPHPILFLTVVVVVTALALAVNRVEPAAPGPFYSPPAPLPDGAPGTIIRSEPVSPAPAGAQAWKVLYRSTGLQNQPIAVSGMVFVPNDTAPAEGRKVVAWAHGTTGVASRCAPSLENGGGASKIPGLALFLQAGYVVTATDYPGLGTAGPHPYLVGASEGMAVIDSVRAARQLPAAGASATFALWGHSQGGHAALFAAQLTPTYGSDLSLVGVATAAPATNLPALLEKDIGGIAGNVLGSMAVVSWSQVYADQGVQLGQVVHTDAIPSARLIADHCIETEAQLAVDLPEAEVLRVSFLSDAPWSTPPWEALMQANSAGGTRIEVPVLVNQGTADTVVWPPVTAEYVQQQCAQGVNMAEKQYDGVTHTDIATTSANDTATWLAARFAGAAAPPACPSP